MATSVERHVEPVVRRRFLPRIEVQGIGFAATLAGVCLLIIVLMGVLAPLIATHDPIQMDPTQRLKPASDAFLLGTDAYGRDLFSRIVYGARISLIVGVGAAIISVVIGLPLGLLAGFFRILDAILMRIMDGLMAIPSILLAIAVVSWVTSLTLPR